MLRCLLHEAVDGHRDVLQHPSREVQVLRRSLTEGRIEGGESFGPEGPREQYPHADEAQRHHPPPSRTLCSSSAFLEAPCASWSSAARSEARDSCSGISFRASSNLSQRGCSLATT